MKNLIEIPINPCLKCGSSEPEPEHQCGEDKPFLIWIRCRNCGAVAEHSFTTYLDAVREWNRTNNGQIAEN